MNGTFAKVVNVVNVERGTDLWFIKLDVLSSLLRNSVWIIMGWYNEPLKLFIDKFKELS